MEKLEIELQVFITSCKVGEMDTEGEGNGKKVSKRRAAERMLEEMRRRWPAAALRTRTLVDKRRHTPAKKKARNLIKVMPGQKDHSNLRWSFINVYCTISERIFRI